MQSFVMTSNRNELEASFRMSFVCKVVRLQKSDNVHVEMFFFKSLLEIPRQSAKKKRKNYECSNEIVCLH